MIKNRKNYLKAREKALKWKLIGEIFDSECPNCGQKVFMYNEFDSKCCIYCNVWLEAACGDPDCPYCGKRPGTPHEAYYLKDTVAGSAGQRKRWRRENYQHKTDGEKRHLRRRELRNNE